MLDYLQELRTRVLHGKYCVPFGMSTDCENLIKKLLVLNPANRACLEVRVVVCMLIYVQYVVMLLCCNGEINE